MGSLERGGMMASLHGREPDVSYVRSRESFALSDIDGAHAHHSASAPKPRLGLEPRIGTQAIQRLLQCLPCATARAVSG
jgi:hypothetical protein